MTNTKELFYGDGNDTVVLPAQAKGGTVLTDPHTKPGQLIPTKKVIQKGFSK